MSVEFEFPIKWEGPFDWPLLRRKSPLDKICGVYLYAIESPNGFVCSGCGITGRTIRKRLMEHRRGYLIGAYTMLDLDAMRQGIRKEIWHGMWAGHNSVARRSEFARRKEELQSVAEGQMSAIKIFGAAISDRRTQERLEAAIVQSLYQAEKPYCDLPDRGTLRMPRRNDESAIVFINQTPTPFVNLPDQMRS